MICGTGLSARTWNLSLPTSPPGPVIAGPCRCRPADPGHRQAGRLWAWLNKFRGPGGVFHPTVHLEEEDDMTTPHHRLITTLVSGALALGCCASLAAPASADPDPFGANSCNCPETAPPGDPAVREEIERGIRAGLAAVSPGLPPRAQTRQAQPLLRCGRQVQFMPCLLAFR
jgi:hypothetical protein